jgi:hypothetical protein
MKINSPPPSHPTGYRILCIPLPPFNTVSQKNKNPVSMPLDGKGGGGINFHSPCDSNEWIYIEIIFLSIYDHLYTITKN